MNAATLDLETREIDAEGTTKYLWRLADGRRIETVFFSHHAGAGQCLSTQTGCAIGCTFCATALQRPARNLTAAEIAMQASAMDAECRARGLSVDWRFVTLSGMGEAMLNYQNVVEAGRALYDWSPIEVVSVTSSGVVPGIRRLVREDVYLQLHVSLHATTDEVRTRLIPTTRKWGIAEILAACRDFADRWQRRVIVNYLLFDGVNNTAADAERLAELLDPQVYEVHLLLWNEIPGFPFRRIDDESVRRFGAWLAPAGLLAKPMPSKGRDIRAGCGQLLAESRRTGS